MAKKVWLVEIDYGESSYLDTGTFVVQPGEVSIELSRVDGDFTIVIPRSELAALLEPSRTEGQGEV